MPEPHHNEASGVRELVQARDVHGNVIVGTLPPPPPPRRLPPADIRHTDREAELRTIQEVATDVRLRGRGRLILVRGDERIGKTSLLNEAGHLMGGQFPGGCVYRDLGTWRNNAGELDLSAALRTLLRDFHIADADRDASLEELRDRLRGVTAENGVLLLIDGAHDAEELGFFTPGTGPSLLIAGCCPGFHGAARVAADNGQVIDLTGFTDTDGLQLLREFPAVREHMRDPGGIEQARHLVELCGGLPAALRMVAGLLETRREVGMGRVITAIHEVRRRFPRMSGFDAVTEVALDRLSERERSLLEVYCLIGGRSVPPGLGAAALGDEAADLQSSLITGGVLNRVGETDIGVAEAVGARVRAGITPLSGRWRRRADTVLRFSTVAHHHADLVVSGERYRLADRIESSLATLPPASYVAPFKNKREASDWQDGRLGDLPALMELAVQAGRERDALLLACSAWSTVYGRRRLAQGAAVYASALELAQRSDEPAAVVRCAVYWARILIELGRAEPERVLREEHGRRAAELIAEAERAVGDELDRAVVLEARGILESRILGAAREDAVELLERSRDIHRGLGRPRGDALQTYQLAEQARRSGDLERAEEELRAAAEVAVRRLEQLEASAGDRWAADDWKLILARIDLALARVLAQTGRTEEASALARRVTLVYSAAAEPVRLVRAQLFLAELARRQGDGEQARAITEEARTVAEAYHVEAGADRY